MVPPNALRRDVATYDRADTSYPFLREFSPFYGHSWANGTADAGGNDQESTSEAINFAVGLIELGQLTGNNEWRDLGLYMFEEEILATEQYRFNQDADLTRSPAGSLYNGNWPASLVDFKTADGTARKTTLITNRSSSEYFAIPFRRHYRILHDPGYPAERVYRLSGRNQNWLKATWEQFLQRQRERSPASIRYDSEPAGSHAGYGADSRINWSCGALTRINTPHDFFPASPNVTGKHFAYSHAQLGELDTTVVADTPMYGVFKNGSVRSYCAYNLTGVPQTVMFLDASSGSPVKSLVPPPDSTATVSDSQPGAVVDLITPYHDSPSRLYLRSAGQLLPAPGTSMPPEGTSPWPVTSGALAQTLQTVDVRPDKGSSIPLVPPDASLIQSWTGSFSGSSPRPGMRSLDSRSMLTRRCVRDGSRMCRAPPTSSRCGSSMTSTQTERPTGRKYCKMSRCSSETRSYIRAG